MDFSRAVAHTRLAAAAAATVPSEREILARANLGTEGQQFSIQLVGWPLFANGRQGRPPCRRMERADVEWTAETAAPDGEKEVFIWRQRRR